MSGVPSIQRGVLVLGVIISAVLLQLFGSSMFWQIHHTYSLQPLSSLKWKGILFDI